MRSLTQKAQCGGLADDDGQSAAGDDQLAALAGIGEEIRTIARGVSAARELRIAELRRVDRQRVAEEVELGIRDDFKLPHLQTGNAHFGNGLTTHEQRSVLEVTDRIATESGCANRRRDGTGVILVVNNNQTRLLVLGGSLA